MESQCHWSFWRNDSIAGLANIHVQDLLSRDFLRARLRAKGSNQPRIPLLTPIFKDARCFALVEMSTREVFELTRRLRRHTCDLSRLPKVSNSFKEINEEVLPTFVTIEHLGGAVRSARFGVERR